MTRFIRIERFLTIAAGLGLLACGVRGDNALTAQGGEYGIIGSRPGDEVQARLSIRPQGGFVVWQDNLTDGDGSGISARILDSSLTGTLSSFQVNEITTGNQGDPEVATLSSGGAVFVWQGEVESKNFIYARFLQPDGTFATGDIQVNAFTGASHSSPKVAGLSDGSAVVIWASYEQDGHMQGVFGQRFAASGERLGAEFQVNQSTFYNQRSPDVAALPDGGFVVVWISESYVGIAQNTDASGVDSDGAGGLLLYRVSAMARTYSDAGTPRTAEIAVSDAGQICANPDVSVDDLGRCLAVWSGRAGTVRSADSTRVEGWDIFGRVFGSDGSFAGGSLALNATTYGDQYVPRTAAQGDQHLVVWTSLGQDGSYEGVYAAAVAGDGSVAVPEFRINTETRSRQMFPTVASDRDQRFLVLWSCFYGGVESMDLVAQRYSTSPALVAPGVPYVAPLSPNRLNVTWPEMAGFDVAEYQVYIDGASTPETTQENLFTIGGLLPASTHTVQLAYRLTDGRQSPLSGVSTASTWGEDEDFDGLPDDWQALYWPGAAGSYPAPNEDTDGDGASNRSEFLAGTDPADENSVLRLAIVDSPEGWRLVWNTMPGSIYQLEQSANATDWVPVGAKRFAPGLTDSIAIEGSEGVSMYRLIRIR